MEKADLQWISIVEPHPIDDFDPSPVQVSNKAQQCTKITGKNVQCKNLRVKDGGDLCATHRRKHQESKVVTSTQDPSDSDEEKDPYLNFVPAVPIEHLQSIITKEEEIAPKSIMEDSVNQKLLCALTSKIGKKLDTLDPDMKLLISLLI